MQQDISGAQVLARCLSSYGIKFIFTVTTPRLAPLITALESEPGVRVICAHNETAAALMAEGYIRRSRLQAAVLTDAFGRAISQVCGVTNAWTDKIPLVSLSLCADDEPDGNKSVERWRFDQRAVFQAVTRWNTRLTTPDKMPGQIMKALQESCHHRMGPVHIDIPFKFLTQTIAENSLVIPCMPVPLQPLKPVRLRGEDATVKRAVELIMSARKPLVFCGGGVKASDACAELLTFLETFQIPVATSMGGMGSVPISHFLCLGGPSYTAGETFHVAVQEADVVLALGVAFSGLDGFGLPPVWSAGIKFIHVDIDALQIGLNVQTAVAIQGDVQTVLGQLTDAMAEAYFQGSAAWSSWRKMLGHLKRDRVARLTKDAGTTGKLMHQGKFAEEVGKIVKKGDAVMIMDGGNTPLYLSMYAPDIGPRQIFFPFGMAALGVGVPYAIGCALAAPDTQVILATGDGSFLYNVQELETIRRLKLPIIIFINNDNAWNMIRSMQDSFFAQNFVGTDLEGVEYAPIARGLGLKAQRLTNACDILPAYEQARRDGLPAIIECITDKINTPDSLRSFAMVEFEGVLKYLNPLTVLRSLLKMRKLGIRRNIYQWTYVTKALLRINLRAGRS